MLVCMGSVGDPAEIAEAVYIGVRLSGLTLTLGEAISLPEAQRQFGSMALQLYTTDRLRDDVAHGEQLLTAWVEEDPQDAPWTESLHDSLNAVHQAWEELALLPAARLSAIPEEDLPPLMNALDTVKIALEELEESIETQLASVEERWLFHIGFLCWSLVRAPKFPPPLPEDESRFLAHELPAHLPDNVVEDVRRMLDLLPEYRQLQPPEWGSAEQREEATELAWKVLVWLGAEEKVDSAGEI